MFESCRGHHFFPIYIKRLSICHDLFPLFRRCQCDVIVTFVQNFYATAQAICAVMGIMAGGGGYVLVPHKFAYGVDINSTLRQPGCKCPSKGMNDSAANG